MSLPETQGAITSTSTLAQLALQHAGASRVFHRHRLDFCCHGDVSLTEVCEAKGLDLGALIEELQAEEAPPLVRRWDQAPLPDLIDHILDSFHARHREEVPRLIAMASRVEAVHGQKESCPRGLAETLERVGSELESHMQKEEQVLFPMLRAGAVPLGPIQVMEQEHLEHARNLEELRALAHDYDPPAEACGTWRALYLGLAQLERDVMEHIHLENHVLFPRAGEPQVAPPML
jgi:regulator of cell morphogenesis and NO signaling